MNFLCPACRTPLPKVAGDGVVPCTRCGVEVDLTRLDTAPGTARLWPDLDLAGESLADYKLIHRLAAGGMGVVYEAEGPKGPCAVKVLSALLAAAPELRTRFRREAAALRAIEHPGVVRILAEGEERGFCWYAMERVQGSDLRARIEQGALPASEVDVLARRLLETLSVVHGKGFVHRDIKPGNILLSASGPKLCDFGIARFDGSSTLTESAAVLGSLRYMAPEQRLGRADARSDLYAVGVVLHEALAKGVPGEAVLPRNVPAKLRRLVERLLSDRPIDRPADAHTALVEMDRRPKGPIALGLGAVAAICLAAWFALGVIPSAQPGTAGEERAEGEPTQAQALPAAGTRTAPLDAPRTNALGNGNQALQQQADPPQEVLDAVGLAPANPQAARAQPPNLDKTPNDPLGTKLKTIPILRGGKTQQAPGKAPRQALANDEEQAAKAGAKPTAAYDKKKVELESLKDLERKKAADELAKKLLAADGEGPPVADVQGREVAVGNAPQKAPAPEDGPAQAKEPVAAEQTEKAPAPKGKSRSPKKPLLKGEPATGTTSAGP